ncbi:probable E3 ubiquitin-protein ligase RHY1A isoform X1 [Durio zibethinus]|uniref:Probable E3 ubiquitin-protein ligase RHY1A isoform X1 n=1 Tax=Durio zibethinus TaxID=66656 RepID=A0A6P5ZFN7_DURZI|nr:probable E3 ubiquitin-protein ligase RHY1A isoform X1 [Durio zibethinus]
MAGMLPGVECARRRRIYQSGGSSDSPSLAATGLTRRSTFCLYTSNHETHNSSVSSQKQRSILIQAHQDERLGGAAGEAKERLDQRLRTQRKSKPERQNSKESLKCVDGRCLIQGELHTEASGSKKSGQKRFSWTKLRWKASVQEECAICLERFKAGETQVHPPCSHQFHSRGLPGHMARE